MLEWDVRWGGGVRVSGCGGGAGGTVRWTTR